jgi:hypothetical protein
MVQPWAAGCPHAPLSLPHTHRTLPRSDTPLSTLSTLSPLAPVSSRISHLPCVLARLYCNSRVHFSLPCSGRWVPRLGAPTTGAGRGRRGGKGASASRTLLDGDCPRKQASPARRRVLVLAAHPPLPTLVPFPCVDPIVASNPATCTEHCTHADRGVCMQGFHLFVCPFRWAVGTSSSSPSRQRKVADATPEAATVSARVCFRLRCIAVAHAR